MDRLHARGKPVMAPPVMVRLQGHVLFVGAVVYALRRKRESRAGAREVNPAARSDWRRTAPRCTSPFHNFWAIARG